MLIIIILNQRSKIYNTYMDFAFSFFYPVIQYFVAAGKKNAVMIHRNCTTILLQMQCATQRMLNSKSPVWLIIFPYDVCTLIRI